MLKDFCSPKRKVGTALLPLGRPGRPPPSCTAIAYNGPRVYEPARRAQAVAPLLLCNRRDRRAGCRRPSTRRVRSVKPLLYVRNGLRGQTKSLTAQTAFPVFSFFFSFYTYAPSTFCISAISPFLRYFGIACHSFKILFLPCSLANQSLRVVPSGSYVLV